VLASGRFAECSGLEASMEAKAVKAGGRNMGVSQLAGRVNFATVILKRGITAGNELWRWFYDVAGGSYERRLRVEISLLPFDGGRDDQPIMTWQFARALPVKFKSADLNAKSNEIGIEELHFVHEGMSLK
jgi:phage tail-like protein